MGDRREAAQPGFGIAGPGIGIEELPARRCAIEPPIDLLADRGVEDAIAFGEAGDPKKGESRKRWRREPRDVALGVGAPAYAADGRVVVAATDYPVRIIAGEHLIDPRSPVTVHRHGANLLDARRHARYRKRHGRPGTGRVVSAHDLARAAQIPPPGDQHRARPHEPPAPPLPRKR